MEIDVAAAWEARQLLLSAARRPLGKRGRFFSGNSCQQTSHNRHSSHRLEPFVARRVEASIARA